MKDRRTAVRRLFSAPCWVATEPVRLGVVVDISTGGARIQLDGAEQLPPQIELYFNQDLKVGRVCRVAWSADKQAGLEFLGACQATRIEGDVLNI